MNFNQLVTAARADKAKAVTACVAELGAAIEGSLSLALTEKEIASIKPAAQIIVDLVLMDGMAEAMHDAIKAQQVGSLADSIKASRAAETVAVAARTAATVVRLQTRFRARLARRNVDAMRSAAALRAAAPASPLTAVAPNPIAATPSAMPPVLHASTAAAPLRYDLGDETKASAESLAAAPTRVVTLDEPAPAPVVARGAGVGFLDASYPSYAYAGGYQPGGSFVPNPGLPYGTVMAPYGAAPMGMMPYYGGAPMGMAPSVAADPYGAAYGVPAAGYSKEAADRTSAAATATAYPVPGTYPMVMAPAVAQMGLATPATGGAGREADSCCWTCCQWVACCCDFEQGMARADARNTLMVDAMTGQAIPQNVLVGGLLAGRGGFAGQVGDAAAQQVFCNDVCQCLGTACQAVPAIVSCCGQGCTGVCNCLGAATAACDADVCNTVVGAAGNCCSFFGACIQNLGCVVQCCAGTIDCLAGLANGR